MWMHFKLRFPRTIVERSPSMPTWIAGFATRTQWCPMATGTAGTVPTVISTTASRRWVWNPCASDDLLFFWSVNCSRIQLLSSVSSVLFIYLFIKSFVVFFSFSSLLLFQNGDYNKPIPAQYLEHLNHGVSGGVPASETPKTLQWVNCQMLLCKKCNNNQTVKIKQLASFIPRDDVCTLFPSFIPLQFHRQL